jgi:hypothetical protein
MDFELELLGFKYRLYFFLAVEKIDQQCLSQWTDERCSPQPTLWK